LDINGAIIFKSPAHPSQWTHICNTFLTNLSKTVAYLNPEQYLVKLLVWLDAVPAVNQNYSPDLTLSSSTASLMKEGKMFPFRWLFKASIKTYCGHTKTSRQNNSYLWYGQAIDLPIPKI